MIYFCSVGSSYCSSLVKLESDKCYKLPDYIRSMRGKLQVCPTKPVFAPSSLKVAWSGKSLIGQSSQVIAKTGRIGGLIFNRLTGKDALFIQSDKSYIIYH